MKAIVQIENVFKITGIGTVVVGLVKEGILKVGMKADIQGKVSEVKSIEKDHKQLKEANQGDSIGINLYKADPNVLKLMKGQTLSFYDRMFQTPEPIHPKGTFSFLKKIFK